MALAFTDEMQAAIKNAPYLTLITLNEDGSPHPVIVGGKTLAGDTIEVGIYKLETTQKNLATNEKTWALAAAMGEGPMGFCFLGSSSISEGKLIFTAESATVLI